MLCQQELGADASARLGRFESFVRDDSSRRAETAAAAYAEGMKTMRAASIPLATVRPLVATIEEELGDPAPAAQVRGSVISLLWRLRESLRHRASDDHHDWQPLTTEPPLDKLPDLSAGLETRANTLVSDTASPAMRALIVARDELAAREWLAGVKADVVLQIERLKAIATLVTADGLTATNRITSKSTELAKTLVTDTLHARFACVSRLLRSRASSWSRALSDRSASSACSR